MSSNATRQLAELIEQKYECLLRMRAIGHQQELLIADDDLTQLLRLLVAKQQLLGRLHEIEHQLDPYRGAEPQERDWRRPEDRRRCAELLRCCESVLGEIVEQERRSEASLKQRRDEAAQRLAGFHRAGLARGAYGGDAALRPTQLDLSSDST